MLSVGEMIMWDSMGALIAATNFRVEFVSGELAKEQTRSGQCKQLQQLWDQPVLTWRAALPLRLS
jgi:hypothetical protein